MRPKPRPLPSSRRRQAGCLRPSDLSAVPHSPRDRRSPLGPPTHCILHGPPSRSLSSKAFFFRFFFHTPGCLVDRCWHHQLSPLRLQQTDVRWAGGARCNNMPRLQASSIVHHESLHNSEHAENHSPGRCAVCQNARPPRLTPIFGTGALGLDRPDDTPLPASASDNRVPFYRCVHLAGHPANILMSLQLSHHSTSSMLGAEVELKSQLALIYLSLGRCSARWLSNTHVFSRPSKGTVGLKDTCSANVVRLSSFCLPEMSSI